MYCSCFLLHARIESMIRIELYYTIYVIIAVENGNLRSTGIEVHRWDSGLA